MRWCSSVSQTGLAKGVGVADDGLCAFEDAEGVAGHTAVVHGDVAGQDAAIKVLQQQLDGAGVVPVQPLPPAVAFFKQQGTQLRRVEVPEIEHLDVRSDWWRSCSEDR